MKQALIQVWRTGKIESEHSFAGLLFGDDLLQTWGDPETWVFSRSLIKAIQAKVSLDLIRSAGADLLTEQIALLSASHQAETEHLRVLDSILDTFDLSQELIACGFKHNCSGKHAGILVASSLIGADLDYLSPDHPYQQALKIELMRLSMPEETYQGVDGCGLQTYYLSLVQLAKIFRQMIDEPAYLEIITAANRYPFLIGATNQFESLLMFHHPNRFFAKSGAEGLMLVINLELKQVLLIKVRDGAKRAKSFAAAAIMKELSWLEASYQEALSPNLSYCQT